MQFTNLDFAGIEILVIEKDDALPDKDATTLAPGLDLQAFYH